MLKLCDRVIQNKFLGPQTCWKVRQFIGKIIELLLLAITFLGQNYWLLLLPIIFWRLLLLLLTIKNYYWGGSLNVTNFDKVALSLYSEKEVHMIYTFFLDEINATASLWVAEAKGSLSTLKNWSPAFIPCDSAIDPTSTDETKCPTPCSTPPRRLNPKWDCTSSPLSRTKVINWPSTFESSCIFLLPESEKRDKEIYWMM